MVFGEGFLEYSSQENDLGLIFNEEYIVCFITCKLSNSKATAFYLRLPFQNCLFASCSIKKDSVVYF